MQFPVTRLRRLRKSPAIRNMVRETILNPQRFDNAFVCLSGQRS